MAIIDIKVQDRSDPTKTITLKRYGVEKDLEPTAVLFGKYSPFTGPKGHGRMVDFAKKNGFKKIAVVSPSRDKTKAKDEYDANIFSPEDRLDIIKKASKDFGMKIEGIFSVKATNPLGMFREISAKIDRPVIIVGPDRESDFAKFFIPFAKDNETITDTKDKAFGKGEMMAIKSRGDGETSGTKVRKAIVDGDKEEFLKLTGYDQSMYKLMRSKLKLTESVSYLKYIKEL